MGIYIYYYILIFLYYSYLLDVLRIDFYLKKLLELKIKKVSRVEFNNNINFIDNVCYSNINL